MRLDGVLAASRGSVIFPCCSPVHRVGRPSRVRAGSPVLWEAFKRLASDPKLRPGMDLLVLKALTDQEMAKVRIAHHLAPTHLLPHCS